MHREYSVAGREGRGKRRRKKKRRKERMKWRERVDKSDKNDFFCLQGSGC